ncbi:MAG: hypothetical protein E6Y08_03215 [Paenibacillus sp.]|uniref:hypothetical protein n=1 Tax=Paenibacillus sp. TaxID=58172 RepID=UPI002912F03E|nr:hypothetical protein [Paenibacillus sp.]MDU4694799.1 hypothetical protein [Paenibacillus sp.]
MEHIGAWIIFFLVIVGLGVFNRKFKYSAKLRESYEELTQLADRTRKGRTTKADLARWDAALARLEKHPSEYNKLDQDIRLREAYVHYLERHYPEDERLPVLREAAGFRKDSVWGMKMNS